MIETGSARGATEGRRYDKGERRYKHVSSSDRPEFHYERGNPKRIIGKCPNNIGVPTCERILQTAVAGGNGDRSIEFAKRLYAFHDGIIYECRTSDRGRTYHAFPLRGSMPRGVMEMLKDRLKTDFERSAFANWIDTNIKVT